MHKNYNRRAKKAGSRNRNMQKKQKRDGSSKVKQTARTKKNDLMGVKFTWGAADMGRE